jgi:transcriptional regulator with XRE-family HTH domain
MSTVNYFGNYVRARREALEVTMPQLAAGCGVHKNIIASLELGKRKNLQAETLWRIAVGLDLSPGDIFEAWAQGRSYSPSDTCEETPV